jgi:uncharacterized protein (TIGR03435 family)
MRAAILLAFAGILASGQDKPRLEFEVASIKPATPEVAGRGMVLMQGGPGTSDPSQIRYTNVTIRLMIMNAFNVKSFQLTAPGTVDDLHFDVLAKVPKDVTREDTRVMLQNLLSDRFGMKFHHETKEMQAYALTAAKGGVKLKPSADAPPPQPDGQGLAVPSPPKMDKNGFPTIPNGGRGMMMMIVNGVMRGTGAQETISQICDFLGNQLGRPVVDQTGLTGKFDFNLEFAPENMPAGRGGMPPPPSAADAGGAPAPTDPAPTLIGALQEQLGLKLEQKKLPVDIVVVDHIEKTPTEN